MVDIHGSPDRSTTCLPSMRLVLFSAAMTNTSGAVPDSTRVCSAWMYSATGGAYETSTSMSGCLAWKSATTGAMISSPLQDRKVSLSPPPPPPLELPLPQAATVRARAVTAIMVRERREFRFIGMTPWARVGECGGGMNRHAGDPRARAEPTWCTNVQRSARCALSIHQTLRWQDVSINWGCIDKLTGHPPR